MADRYYTTNYNGNGGNMIRVQLHVYTIGTSIENNTTVERADLYAIVDNASYGWWNNYGTEAFIGINGHNTTQTVNFDYRTTGTKTLISSWDTTVPHNDYGNASIGVSAHHYSDLGLGNASISDTYVCDTIPRYATCRQTLSSKTVNSITMNWASDNTIDYVEYSKDGGTNWVNVGSVSATSGSYTISNLTPNTTYSIKTRVKRADSQLKTESSALDVTTYDIAKITSSANWTIGNNTTVSYTNPSGSASTISLGVYYSNTTALAPYRAVTNSPYTFNFTSTENANLYNTIPNATNGTVRIYINTNCNGVNYLHYVERTIYIDQATNKTTFTNFAFADINTNVTSLTGNNQILVKGLSNVTVTIPVANKAVAKNGASMVKYRITIGTKATEVNYSSSADVTATINAVDGANINVSAIDSRGLENTVAKTATWKDYWKPTITTSTAERENGIGTKVLFNISGKYWNDTFGSVTNRFKQLYFRYKTKSASSYSSMITITNSISYSNGDYTTISGSFLPTTNNGSTPLEFAVGTEYDIQFFVVDMAESLVSGYVTLTLNSGIPCTDKYKDSNGNYHVGINQLADANYTLSVKGNLNATTLYQNGSKIIDAGSNNNGNYIKYADGTMICYAEKDLTVDFSSSNQFNIYNSVIYPITFIDNPKVTINSGGHEDYAFCVVLGMITNQTKITQLTLYRPSLTTQNNTKISYIAIGKWK